MNLNLDDNTPLHEDPGSREAAGGIIATVAGQREVGFFITPMNDGWIKVPRSIVEMWLFRNGDYLKIWIYLLSTANYRPSRANLAGEFITIERGQVLTSIRGLSKATGATEKQVRNFIILGQKSGIIRAKKGTGPTVLTIIDYDMLDTRADNEGHTKGTRRAHEGHYLRKKKEEDYTITDTIDRGTNSRSRPASPDEVSGYFRDLGSTDVEAATFYDHFESNGWKVGGRAAMKDWRSAARNWVRRNNKQGTQHAKRTTGERSLEAGTPDSIRQLHGLARPDRRRRIGALELDSGNGGTIGIGAQVKDRPNPAQLLLGGTDIDRV